MKNIVRITQQLVPLFKVLAFTLLLVISCFPTDAMALSRPWSGDFLGLPQSIPIEEGSFSVRVTGTLLEDTRIGSAIISLPPDGESGIIEQLIITGPDEEIEYSCPLIENVQTGTSLITRCGGPAYLRQGETTYIARGHGFKPESATTLTVDLQALYLD